MSGLSNRKFKLVVVLYVLLIAMIVMLFLLYPSIYNHIEKQQQDQKMEQVEKILSKNDQLSDRLAEAAKDSTVELVVLKQQRLIYESLPLKGNLSELKQFVRKENLVYQKTYQYKEYVIWIAFYPQKIQQQFNQLIIFICLLITALVLLMVLVIYYIYYQLLEPLKKLRTSILALKKFNFDQAILVT
ncbi:MAG: hypothetical protein ACLRPU_19370, partial [Enterococcus hulanensis]